MQAVVKTPRIDIRIKGDIPPRLLSVLEAEFGPQVHLSQEVEEELVDIFESGWYRGMKSQLTPGDTLRIYRENRGWTQAYLGEVLGGLPRQHISNMERGRRAISVRMARKLAQVFKVSAAKFI
jgi:antitoxin component HigA of HigAB toxin-antitoxin module